MNVGELLMALKGVAPETKVVRDMPDHEYLVVGCASVINAHDHEDGQTFTQDGGEDCQEIHGKLTPVFHIS